MFPKNQPLEIFHIRVGLLGFTCFRQEFVKMFSRENFREGLNLELELTLEAIASKLGILS